LIYTDRIIKEYQNPAFEASYLILKLNKSKLIKIDTSWFECAETLDSYYRFTIEDITDIKYSIQSIKSIFSFINTDNINNISVVKKEFKDDYFVTIHTCGILIERSDFKRVLITGGESALQNILLCDDEEYIFNFLKDAILESLKIK
jgi:hypothetical protein